MKENSGIILVPKNNLGVHCEATLLSGSTHICLAQKNLKKKILHI